MNTENFLNISTIETPVFMYVYVNGFPEKCVIFYLELPSAFVLVKYSTCTNIDGWIKV